MTVVAKASDCLPPIFVEYNLLWIHLLTFHVGHIFLRPGHTLIICRNQKFLPHKRNSQQQLFTSLFYFHFLLLRILLLFAGCHLNLLRTFDLYSTSSFSVFLACSFSRQPVVQAAVMEHLKLMYGSLLQESDLQSDCSHGDIYSWGLMRAGQRGFLRFPPNILPRALLPRTGLPIAPAQSPI